MNKCIIAVIIFSASATCYGADFDSPILDENNVPVCEEAKTPCPSDRVMTVGRAARNALYILGQDEQNTSGDERYKRAELAARIKGKVDNLKSEEKALIKQRVGKVFGPLVVKRVWDELDPR